MTHTALQHVVVRMMYDARFCESVFQSVDRALARVELSSEEIAWILRADPRAFATDPHRRARSLTGLLEEYPTAAAELVRLARRDPPASVLDDFFSSREFHTGMQAGRSLAISFGEFLVRITSAAVVRREGDPGAGSERRGTEAPTAPLAESADHAWKAAMAHSLAVLELAIARLRRLRLLSLTVSAMARLRTAPTYAWVDVHPQTLDRFAEIRQRIALADVDARAAIVDLELDLGNPEIQADRHEPAAPEETREESVPVLLSARLDPSPAPGGWMRVVDVEISPISAELASVLEAAQSGIETSALLEHVQALGADEAESRDILNDLIRDGVLIEAE